MRTSAAALLALVIALRLTPVQSAEELRLPGAAEVTGCSESSNHGLDYWKGFVFGCQELLQALPQAKVVSEDKWRHEFSHVSGGDRYGHLLLSDGVRLQWMARPGGLAWLEWPNGQRLHLVMCCNKTPPSK